MPPDGWRSGTTRLKIRWRWLDALAFDGDLVRAWSTRDHTVRTWDPDTGEARGTSTFDEIDPPWPDGSRPDSGSVARSADRTRIAGGFGGREVRVMEVASGRVVHTLALPEHGTTRLRFHDDGGLLVLQPRRLSRLDADGRPLASVAVPPRTVDVLSDGELLCLRDRTLVRCDLAGAIRWSVGYPGATLPRSEDGRWLARAGDRAVRVLDLRDGTEVACVTFASGPDRLAVSADGTRLAVGSFGEPGIEVHALGGGRGALPAPFSHGRRLVATAFGPVSLDALGTLRLHDPETGAVRAISSGRAWWDVLPLGRRTLVATTRDGQIGVLALPTLYGTPAGEGSAVRLVDGQPGRLLVVGHRAELLGGPSIPPVWEEAGLDGVRTSCRTLGPPEGGDWLRASRACRGRIALCAGGRIAVVDLRTGARVREVGWSDDAVAGTVDGEPVSGEDGSWLVATTDGRVGLLRRNQTVLEPRFALPEPDPATVVLSIGGRVAVGYADGRVRLWDLATGALLHAWSLHLGRVEALVVCDGRLVSASEDTTVVAVPLPP